MESKRSSSFLKASGILLLVILGLWLVYALVFGSGYGINIRFSGDHGGGSFNMGYGYGFAGTLSFILLFLIKVLFVLFIVGLVVGIAIAVKNYVFTSEDVAKIKSTFTGRKTVIVKEACEICGKELEPDWKVCPHCGKELNTQNV